MRPEQIHAFLSLCAVRYPHGLFGWTVDIICPAESESRQKQFDLIKDEDLFQPYKSWYRKIIQGRYPEGAELYTFTDRGRNLLHTLTKDVKIEIRNKKGDWDEIF